MKNKIRTALRLLREAGTGNGVKRLAKALWDALHPPLWLLLAYRRRVNRLRFSAPAEPLSLVWVDPSSIVHHRKSFVPKRDVGRVVGGDWDKLDLRYDDLAKHKAIEQRVEFSRSWEETGIFEYLEHFVATRGRPIDGCLTRTEMEERYERIDDLIENVRTSGYVPDTVVIEDGRPAPNALDQICVNIGRHGEIIFNGGGHHRLSLAKVLGVPSVPVLVIVRHLAWQRTRDSVARGAMKPGTTPTHPDLRDLTTTSTQSSGAAEPTERGPTAVERS